MLTFHQRTEIIREMIADRMKHSPHPCDISLSELQNWPDLLIWGTPEGTIFNIVASYYLNIKQGCDSEEAIREIEELEERNVKAFSGGDLIEYLIFRLREEHSLFVNLYPEELLEFFQNLVKKKLQIYECEIFKTRSFTSKITTRQSEVQSVGGDMQSVTKEGEESSSSKKIEDIAFCFVLVVVCIMIIMVIEGNLK